MEALEAGLKASDITADLFLQFKAPSLRPIKTPSRKLVGLMHKLPEMVNSNIVVAACIARICMALQWQGRTSLELFNEITRPGFGNIPFLDMLLTKMQSRKDNVDEYIRLVMGLVGILEEHVPGCSLRDDLLSVCAEAIEHVRSPANVVASAAALVGCFRRACYFNPTVPSAESLLFSDLDGIREAFFPDPSRTLEFFFKRLPTPLKAVSPVLPDPSILYCLTLGWQRLVNARDLFHQFAGVVQSDLAKDGGSRRALMCRFTHSLAELEMIGFLAPTGPRRDYYERLNLGDAMDEP